MESSDLPSKLQIMADQTAKLSRQGDLPKEAAAVLVAAYTLYETLASIRSALPR